TEVAGDFEKFVNIFISVSEDGTLQSDGLFWVVDDFVGVFYMNNIIPTIDATLHYAFFDKRMKGRIDLCIEMINFIFEKYQFRRLTVEIPTYASPHTSYIVEKVIGFKYEGKKRGFRYFDGKWFDSR